MSIPEPYSFVPLVSAPAFESAGSVLAGAAVPGDVTAVIGSGVGTPGREWIAEATGPWRYVVVFLLAATPLLEVLVVIPPAVALGLDPVLVGAVAFCGNVASVAAIVFGYGRLSKVAPLRGDRGGESKRRARARRLWNAYGLPGLALLAPITTGVHLATLVAFGLRSRRAATLGWMTLSVGLWTVFITVASVTGSSLLASLR